MVLRASGVSTVARVGGVVADLSLLDACCPGNLFAYQDRLYFAASDTEHGRELWVFQDAAEDTAEEQSVRLFQDLNPGMNESSPDYFYHNEDNGLLYFLGTAALPAPVSTGLWVTDGTAEGTQLVQRADEHVEGPIVELNGDLYFTSIENKILRAAVGGGAEGGVVADLRIDGNACCPGNIFAYQGRFYFAASGEELGRELWVYDERNGAQLFFDLNPGAVESSPDSFYIHSSDGLLYFLGFAAWPTPVSTGLWVTNGTVEGTQLVLQADNQVEGPIVELNGVLYFTSYDDQILRAVVNGGVRGGGIVALAGNACCPGNLVVYQGRLYFAASDSDHGRELWVYDDENGARLFLDLNPGPVESSPDHFLEHNGLLYFLGTAAWPTPVSTGLWVTDGTAEGTQLVQEADDQVEGPIVELSGDLYFTSLGNKIIRAVVSGESPSMTAFPTEAPTPTSMAPPPTEAPTPTSMTTPPTEAPIPTSMTAPPTEASTPSSITAPPTEAPTPTSVTAPPTEASTPSSITASPTEASTPTSITAPLTEAPTPTSMTAPRRKFPLQVTILFLALVSFAVVL